MRPIPLNIQTLYADLLDQVAASDVQPASITRRKSGGKTYLYATMKDGSERIQKGLGPETSDRAKALAERHKAAETHAKQRRSTVSALKAQRIPAPTLQVGRILETVANAGLFGNGLVLVGTHAFRLFPCVLGCYLPNSALATNDVDFSAASFVASGAEIDFEAVLKRADKSFAPVWAVTDKKPKQFKAANGMTVDLLTAKGRGRKSPVVVGSLGVSAEALSFQEYIAYETIDVVALYGSGVLVKIPTPARYAVHKLIIAGRRGANNPKSVKDLRQAQDLIDALIETDEASLEDALDDARSRGKAWKSAVNASLKSAKREYRQGRLPLKL